MEGSRDERSIPMTGTAIREAARVAALILVLVLAAALGLAVGNALQGRSGAGIGAPAADAAADIGTPSFADPYRQLIRQAAQADAADHASLDGPRPR